MAQYPITLSDGLETIAASLQEIFHTRTRQDTMRHALMLLDAIARHADGDTVTVMTKNGALDLYLPADPLLKLVRDNERLRNRHAGERCFIVASGPSLKRIDLKALAGETVITLSRGYSHPDFDAIAPRYHCVTRIFREHLSDTKIRDFFIDMDRRIGSAELFLSTSEEPIVRENGIFLGRTMHYLHQLDDVPVPVDGRMYDLCRCLPSVQSVPVLGLMIAMYMGFQDIYLLGVDHDEVWTRTYYYAHEPSFKFVDPSVGANGEVVTTTYDLLQNYAVLWREYRRCRMMAERNGCRIYNASPESALDEFERVDFGGLMLSPSPRLLVQES
ncbi:hypothetical protein [Azospirillum doebereinerae]|uniref:DUF115 domain-containing protein n=1 Tax=Azospirillum doebereinerae TaxID=92933 RepID=A0A3S0WY55_9PROT|nr:hypothetical protein [Azospirillum doebereinerae]MCG5238888.1 hypothetical protein [Azospirillum doebereinerae]RUQ68901.1 hypothetical protein EJ913_17160 [Azospirillum doebereinerae]